MSRQGNRVVVLIGAFKLLKAALLVALGVSGLIIPEQVRQRAGRMVVWMGAFPGHHTVDRLLASWLSLNHRTEQRFAVLSLAYAAVFLVEGLGLLRRRHWAEWLTVAVTTSFIPIEIYEIVEHLGPGKIIASILNATIVGYLVLRLVADRRASHHRVPPSPAT